MKVVLEMDFETRPALDAYIRSRFGEDRVRNESLYIEAPEAKLTALGLSESDTVFGVRVVKQVEEKKKK